MSAGKHAIERLFSPEFRNRLSEVVFFDALSQEIMEQIVDKFIDELNAQLAARHIALNLDPAARTWLARHGYDRQYGARPLARLIQTTIRRPLSEEVLFGELQNGGLAKVDLREDAIAIQAHHTPQGSENNTGMWRNPGSSVARILLNAAAGKFE